jgi:hypothetical protein
MKARQFLIVVFLLAMILAFGLWLVSRNSRTRKPSPISTTSVCLNIIENGIEAETIFNHRFPCDLSVLPTNIPNETMYSFLVYTQSEPYYHSYTTTPGEKFPDAWHNEMHFRVDRNSSVSTNSKTISLKMIVWSNGSNEKDDNGEGDDIKREIIIELPVTFNKEVSH